MDYAQSIDIKSPFQLLPSPILRGVTQKCITCVPMVADALK